MRAQRHLPGKPAAAPVAAGRARCRHHVRPVRPPAAQQQPQPQQQMAAPELRRVAHSATWHGHERPDEYHWLDGRGPTDAELLAHLRAESQHTISQLAHTRQLQLELQAALNAWLMAAALQPWQPSEQPELCGASQQQRVHNTPVAPDWLAGSGVLQYQQRQSFSNGGSNASNGADSSNTTPQAQGLELGGFAFFSQQHAGAPASHYRAPATSFAAAAAAGGVLPGDAVLLWSEAAGPGSSSSSSSRDGAAMPRWQRPANAVHSLAMSPCGSFLAVTFTCSSSSSSDAAAGGGGCCSLAVIDCSSGELLLQPVHGVDGAVQWVQQQQQQQPQQQAGGQRCVMYVAGRTRQVCCLRLPTLQGPAAAAAAAGAAGSAEAAAAAACGRGAALLPAPQPVVVYSDPLRVSLSIAEAGGMSFIVVFAADGQPRRVMFHSSSSSCSGRQLVAPDDPAAWRSLLPAAAVAAADTAADNDEADDDPTARLVVTPHGRLLFARYSSAAQPQGLVYVAQLPQLGQQELAWQRLPLALQPGQQLEALFVSAAAGGRQQAGLQLLALVSQQQQQQQQPGTECSGCSFVSQALSAHCYSLTPQTDAQQQQGQRRDGLPWLQLQLQSACRLPMPEPYFELLIAAWWPGQGAQLQLTFSSLIRPATVMTAELEQLAALQQQEQRTAPAAGAARGRAVHLRQLQPAPAAFEQAAYAALQIAVPSTASASAAPAGCEPVAVPVSLAFGRAASGQLPACFLQASNLQRQEVDAGGGSGSTPAGQPRPAGPPLLLCCYGSYSIRESVAFSAELLQLLDCGWVVAVAHVRGGGWLGRSWAEAGRGLGKRCSVQDLLAVAHQLQQAGLCAAGRLAVQGSSAGAWLAASAMLQQPQLFAAAVLSVPCLDPLGLLLEQQHGWLELGDAAADAQVYQSMRSWAPYDLLEQLLRREKPARHAASDSQSVHADHATQSSPLPHVLLRAALHDTEVPISDPVKALARMRGHNQQSQRDERLLLLLRVVPGGHAAYSQLLLPQDVREAALKLAFLLSVS